MPAIDSSGRTVWTYPDLKHELLIMVQAFPMHTASWYHDRLQIGTADRPVYKSDTYRLMWELVRERRLMIQHGARNTWFFPVERTQ